MLIRRATLRDVKSIFNLISFFAKDNLMLPRSINEISEHIREYLVAEDNLDVVGCCALQTYVEGLCEIKALAVRQDYQKKKIGVLLVRNNIEEAKKLGAEKVFVLTYIDSFFEKLGFKKISKDNFPQKIWGECIKCVKFPDCDEIAMIKELNND